MSGVEVQVLIGLASVLGAIALWLMLPRGAARGRRLGAVLGLASVGLLAWVVARPALAGGQPLGSLASQIVFYLLAAVTVIAAGATVTLRSPVYCAIWFALSLLGTAGLFLFDGAQFLGVATIVVYAGAILVTFLFVLMLAQPQGDAFYDRISWEGLLSASTGALLVGVLTLTLLLVFQNPNADARPLAGPGAAELEGNVLAPQHMARLGAELFSRYLIPVEIAGTLLLVALVGAVAIVAQSAQTSIRLPGASAPLRLDPRSVAPCGGPEDERLAAAGKKAREVSHG